MKNSPLAQRHSSLSATMADFGGYLMPIEYPGAGVLTEHAAVREKVGIFDVSHLGKVSVIGDGALDFLNSVFTNDLNRIMNGQAQYTLHCNSSGGVIDDLIVYRNSANDLFLIPNASNTSAVVANLLNLAPPEIVITNLHEAFGVIAVQGPRSREVLGGLGVDPQMDYMAFSRVEIAGCQVTLCRTGYTGEHGYEIVPIWDQTTRVWDALVTEIKKFDGQVCGLGARDTLRTEMGYPLHGHELSLSISPVQASASWAVAWDKPSFSGSDELRREKQSGEHRRIRALVSQDRGIPRAGMQVKSLSGELLGEVTSGTYSPTLKKGIALALLAHSVKLDDRVVIDVRGRESSAVVTRLPLTPSHVR
jgi:aminomethyltransferase